MSLASCLFRGGGPGGLALALVVCVSILGLGSCGKLVGEVEVFRATPADAGGELSTRVEEVSAAEACQGGAVRCQGPVLQHCGLDGSGWRSVERCASAALCVAREGELSRCSPPACEPGLSCEGNLLRQCAPDRAAYEEIESCISAAHCDSSAGACQQAPCVAGKLRCNGATLQRCTGTPAGYDELAACATAALCEDWLEASCGEEPAACDVVGARCPAPICEPGQLRCEGARLESCNSGRNGWDFVDECVTAGVCEATRQNPVAVSCLEASCDPGDTVCSPTGAILACNVEQTAYESSVAQCRSVDFCTPSGCQADFCTPGASSCNGSVLQLCQESPDGSSLSRVTVADCQTQQLCQAALVQAAGGPLACSPPRCAAGEFRCAGRQMQVCNAGRTDFVNHELCATDALCEAGAGLGACPAPCTGFACSGSMLRGCNAGLTGFVDQENCGTAAECNSVAGRCDDPCVSGQRRCNGAALEQCQSPLDGWQRLETCETEALCQLSSSVAQTTCEAPRCAPGERRCTGQVLEACNAGRTGFVRERICGAEQVCDAANRQCDLCVAGAVSCEGDLFSSCSVNGQQQALQECGEGLCSSSGKNVGCLQCATANAFRCDNQGSLFQCSADQELETQLEVCRTPQLCRAQLGQCLECDPPGSSRCNGAEVLVCSPQHTESVLDTCATAALCRSSGTTAQCESSECAAGALECTSSGEVLVCNAGQTGYRQQSPRVVCPSPALCDASVPGGCRAAGCLPGERRCNGAAIEVCRDDLTAFRLDRSCGAEQVCSPTLKECVQCLRDADCPLGQSCAGNSCSGGELDGGT